MGAQHRGRYRNPTLAIWTAWLMVASVGLGVATAAVGSAGAHASPPVSKLGATQASGTVTGPVPAAGTAASSATSSALAANVSAANTSLGANLPPLEEALNASFCSWYAAESSSLGLSPLNATNVRSAFATFLAHDPTGRALFQQVDDAEQVAFAAENHAVGQEFLSSGATSAGAGSSWEEVDSPQGTLPVLSAPGPDSSRYFVPATAIQGNDVGEWVYVAVTYYTVNLYLFQVTYGEHDDLYVLYEGAQAQSAYTSAESSTSSLNLAALITGVIGVGLGIAAIALPLAPIVLLATAIISVVLAATGLLINALATQAGDAFTTMYDSTYTGEPTGSQYFEPYLSDFYYYPWITLVGTLASSVGMFGELSNGDSVTVLGNYPGETSEAASFSGDIQSIGGNIGWNRWVESQGPSVELLAGYSATPYTSGWSYTFSFTVPSGVSHVLLLYTFNDDETATVNLPPVLTSEEQFGDSTGIAFGAPAAGTYSASFSGGSGWVNTVSVAAYGISNDNGYGYQFGAASMAKTLTLLSGGSEYIGVMMTGGVPITSDSLTTISEEAVSPPGDASGDTDLIGLQSSNTFSFVADAEGYGLAGVAIIPEATVNFEETGLPVGVSWSITFNGATEDSTTSIVTFQEIPGTYSFTVGSVEGYASSPTAGSVTVSGPVSVSIVFVTTIVVQLLGGYAATPDTTSWAGYTLSFTVPDGVTHELFLWSIEGSDDSTGSPTLPAGMVMETDNPWPNVFSGAALGALAAGTYSVTCSSPYGTVYAFSMAVYGVSNDFGFGYEFSNGGGEVETLHLPTGGPYYFGVQTASGGGKITSTSLTTLSEEPQSMAGSGTVTALIGWQTSSTVTFATPASNYASIGVSILPLQYVTFSETGLPAGTQWSVGFGPSNTVAFVPSTVVSSTTSTLTVGEPVNTYAYQITSSGYVADPSTGTVNTSSDQSITVAFQTAIPVQFLNGYAAAPDYYWSGTSLQFTVTSGMTQELLLWSMNDEFQPLITLPTGMTNETSYGTSTGIAMGSLAAGTYTVKVNAQEGWTNTVSIAAYGISGGTNYGFQFASHGTVYDLAMAQGAGAYVGVLATGGVPVQYPSIASPNEEASFDGGDTDLIGAQAVNLFSFWTTAEGWGIAAVAIFPVSSVLFTETGLPAGTSWSVTFDGTTLSSTTPIILFEGDPGTYAYTVGSITGYSASPASGSVALDGPESVDVVFTLSNNPAGNAGSR